MRGPIQKFRLHVLTAVLATAAAAVILVVLVAGSGSLPSVSSEYHVKALVPNAASVSPQSRVTQAGVQIGRVVGVDRQGTGAVIRMQIDKAHSPVAADTKVGIRLRTLVGEKYVELVPGTSQTTVPDDGVLPMSRADDFVDVDTVLSQLRGQTQQRARDTMRGLGGAVVGKGENLNKLVDGASGLINDGAPPVHTLAVQHRQITSLVSNLGLIARDVGARGDSLRNLAVQLNTTATAVASRNTALTRMLAEAPATLKQARETSSTLRATSATVAPVLSRVATAVTGLKPTVKALGPAAEDGRGVVAELRPAAPRLQRTLDNVQKLSGPTVKTLPQLKQTLCQLNPLVKYVAPYGKEVAAVFSNLGSAVNAYDANGHIARLYIGVGLNSVFGVLPDKISQAQNTVFNSGLLAKIRLLGYNPYPVPGQASGITVGAKASGPRDAVNTYKRVTAAC